MTFAAYRGLFRTIIKEDLMSFFGDALPSSIVTLVHCLVTVSIYAAVQKTLFYGIFSWGMMVWYLIFAQVILGAGKGVIKEINTDIQTGAVATAMSKPYSYPLSLYATFLGSIPMELCSTLLVVVPFGIVMGGAVLQARALALGILLVLFAVTINFLVSLCIGLIAFWTEDADPYMWLYGKLMFLVGGMFFPLDVFPAMLGTIVKMLPPAFIIYYPAKLLVRFSWSEFLYVAGMQLIYIALLSSIAYLMFKRATKKVMVNGG